LVEARGSSIPMAVAATASPMTAATRCRGERKGQPHSLR
jgi:hypothetical protein